MTSDTVSRNPVHLYSKYEKLSDRFGSDRRGRMRLGQHEMSGVSLGSSPVLGMIFLVSFSFSWAGFVFSNSSILIDSTISVSVFCFAHDHFVFFVPPS
jgi:hypothetical protein